MNRTVQSIELFKFVREISVA